MDKINEEFPRSLGNQDFSTQLLTDQLKKGSRNASLGWSLAKSNVLGGTLTFPTGTRAQIPSYPNKGPKEPFQLQVAETQADDIEVTDKGLRCDCDVEVSSFL
jgi:hypothetical protein